MKKTAISYDLVKVESIKRGSFLTHIVYSVVQKKSPPLYLTITLAYLNRFSKICIVLIMMK